MYICTAAHIVTHHYPPTCIVRMSKRPRKSLTLISRSNIVLNRSADVPLYQGTMSKKGGWASG